MKIISAAAQGEWRLKRMKRDGGIGSGIKRQMEQVASQQAHHTVVSPRITHHKAQPFFSPFFISAWSLTDLVTGLAKTFVWGHTLINLPHCIYLLIFQEINKTVNMGQPCRDTWTFSITRLLTHNLALRKASLNQNHYLKSADEETIHLFLLRQLKSRWEMVSFYFLL